MELPPKPEDPLFDGELARHLRHLTLSTDLISFAEHRKFDQAILEYLEKHGKSGLLQPKSFDDCVELIENILLSCPYITLECENMIEVKIDRLKEDYKSEEARGELLKLVTICGKYKRFHALRNLGELTHRCYNAFHTCCMYSSYLPPEPLWPTIFFKFEEVQWDHFEYVYSWTITKDNANILILQAHWLLFVSLKPVKPFDFPKKYEREDSIMRL